MTPLFSIIIPTCNRNEMLGQCLEKVLASRQTISGVVYEVIVTDDSKGEGAEKYCKQQFPFVRYTRGPGKGPAANRNKGARLAAGQWLVFTDDDCLPAPEWLNSYFNAINDFPDSLAFEGCIEPDNPALLEEPFTQCPQNMKGGYFWSANIMVSRILFQQVGGFDESYPAPAHEDQQLYYDLLKITQIPFILSARVIHPVRKIHFWPSIMQARLRGKRFGWYVAKTAGPDFDALPFIKHRLGRGAGYILHSVKRMWLKGLFFNLINVPIQTGAELYYTFKYVKKLRK